MPGVTGLAAAHRKCLRIFNFVTVYVIFHALSYIKRMPNSIWFTRLRQKSNVIVRGRFLCQRNSHHLPLSVLYAKKPRRSPVTSVSTQGRRRQRDLVVWRTRRLVVLGHGVPGVSTEKWIFQSITFVIQPPLAKGPRRGNTDTARIANEVPGGSNPTVKRKRRMLRVPRRNGINRVSDGCYNN